MTTKEQIYDAIEKERDHQHTKYGWDKQQSFAGFLLVLERELQEAKDGWMRGIQQGRDSPLYEIVQVAAVAQACLEKYGLEGCPISTYDQIGIKNDSN